VGQVKSQPPANDVQKQFREASFEIVEGGTGPSTIEVRKNNCAQRLERDLNGAWMPQGPPLFLARGLLCELEDRGYQKFWYYEGKRFPIRLSDLKTLHRFVEEIRYILGLKSLYNESLGSVCARTVYDRMNGRPDR
jgi:hypothetical protein